MDVKALADAVSSLATAVIAVTGVLALIYASEQLKQSRETEKVKHLVEFTREFDSELMCEWRKSLAEKWLKGDEYPDETQRLLDFFETVGLLVRRGYLDAHDVWNTFSDWMFNIYATFRDDIEQVQRDQENYYTDFCALLERLRTIEHKEGGDSDLPSKEEIKEFWQEEATIVSGSPMKRRKKAKPKSPQSPL